ncbi:hypothetical protein BBP40_000712 [Aspergillus hancockii]|nr:hypothetical protein BBP40_000712 [Aspergillus hancockii]
MEQSFNKIPSGAKVNPSPFEVNISDEQIQELQLLVKLSKIAPPTFEGLQPDRKYGITTKWLANARETWKDYDCFPQFTYEIEGLNVHFVALFSERQDAIPIVFLHAGSFLEFLPLLSLIREKYTPATLPYHFVVPSHPGYTFSSGPPLDRDFGAEDVARVANQLMVNLGFESGYVAQGGDIGAKIGRILAVDYDGCKAVHLNACFIKKPDNVPESAITEVEKSNLARAEWFSTFGMGYNVEHGTRPSTIGNVIATNPLALLAWVGEKFLDWPDGPLPLDVILEAVSLYWFTETFSRSIYTYREGFPPPKIMPAQDPRWYIHKPFGFSYFPMELLPVPRAWVETTGNLVFHREHEKGGHFAALERPQELLNDVLAFIDQVWADRK